MLIYVLKHIYLYTRDCDHGLISVHACATDRASNCLALFVKTLPHCHISPFIFSVLGCTLSSVANIHVVVIMRLIVAVLVIS
jgi:hypothetical protein